MLAEQKENIDPQLQHTYEHGIQMKDVTIPVIPCTDIPPQPSSKQQDCGPIISSDTQELMVEKEGNNVSREDLVELKFDQNSYHPKTGHCSETNAIDAEKSQDIQSLVARVAVPDIKVSDIGVTDDNMIIVAHHKIDENEDQRPCEDKAIELSNSREEHEEDSREISDQTELPTSRSSTEYTVLNTKECQNEIDSVCPLRRESLSEMNSNVDPKTHPNPHMGEEDVICEAENMINQQVVEEKPCFPVKLVVEDTEDSEVVTVEEEDTEDSIYGSSASSLTEYGADSDLVDDSDELLGIPDGNPRNSNQSGSQESGKNDTDGVENKTRETEIEEIEPLPAEELNFRRFKSQFRLKLSWERIFEKYGREFDSDEIDLQTGEVPLYLRRSL
jgi:hypothetical protein